MQTFACPEEPGRTKRSGQECGLCHPPEHSDLASTCEIAPLPAHQAGKALQTERTTFQRSSIRRFFASQSRQRLSPDGSNACRVGSDWYLPPAFGMRGTYRYPRLPSSAAWNFLPPGPQAQRPGEFHGQRADFGNFRKVWQVFPCRINRQASDRSPTLRLSRARQTHQNGNLQKVSMIPSPFDSPARRDSPERS